MLYMVWDEFNADESEAKEFTESDPYDAAIAYARQDDARSSDGLYTKENGHELDGLDDGQPISVRAATGELYRFKVGIISFDPVFDAMEVTT